jgi:hypothetical protein
LRWLVLFHRYLGIALGLAMAAWCLSGVVMMYVGYPALPVSARMKALAPLDLHGGFALPDVAFADDARFDSFQLEMLGAAPVLRLRSVDGVRQLLDLKTGKALPRVNTETALQVAQTYVPPAGQARTPSLERLVDYDQWTLEGVSPAERPLYRIALNDSDGTLLYVSSVSGRAVQIATSRERFWNWLGAVPHWLYFARLRHNVRLWSQVVIWTSLLGCFLTLSGIYLGVQRFVRRPQGRWSPFRGLLLWHHLPSLMFGLFAFTWVASGLVSMNPWGFLDSSGDGPPRHAISGAHIRDALGALATASIPATAVVSIDSAPFADQLYLVTTAADGARTRLDARAEPAALTGGDVAKFARTLGDSASIQTSAELIAAEDSYYFSHHREIAQLPVFRAVLDDGQRTRIYVDPVSGALLSRIDGNSRWYRWLHAGMHRMDFTSALRTRPLWDVLMLFLLSGVTTVCCTGAILGIRRLVS